MKLMHILSILIMSTALVGLESKDGGRATFLKAPWVAQLFYNVDTMQEVTSPAQHHGYQQSVFRKLTVSRPIVPYFLVHQGHINHAYRQIDKYGSAWREQPCNQCGLKGTSRYGYRPDWRGCGLLALALAGYMYYHRQKIKDYASTAYNKVTDFIRNKPAPSPRISGNCSAKYG